MSKVISSRNHVKARKPHHCCFCHQVIPAGSFYDRRTGVNDSFWTMRMHPECHIYEGVPGVVDPCWYEDVRDPAFLRSDALTYLMTNGTVLPQ